MVTGSVENPYLGRKRPIIIFSPSEEDDRFDGQLLCLNDYKEGFIEREMVLLEIFGRGESRAAGEPLSAVEADSLRKQYGVGSEDFAVVLIGKDGIEKQRWDHPLPPLDMQRAAEAITEEEVREEEVAPEE